jgi:demethylmenaquinone methyltransferase / 2-methoxy-6-polyprenyl-1,4-benzoquinol methylase
LTHLKGRDRAIYVQNMFARIAPRYDLMNRLMTFGRDSSWRREVIRRARLSAGNRLLDMGAGTGDLAREAIKQAPGCQVVAADFTVAMMQIGRTNHPESRLEWTAGDASELPFPGQTFNAVVSGFLLRNVPYLDQCLAEQYRVLKPGGRIVALDTTPPENGFITPFVNIHMKTIIPLLGKAVSGQAEAYQYLPESTINFLEPAKLAARLLAAGFDQVGFSRHMFGTIAIYWGIK